MAISAVHYQLLKEHAPLLKRGGSLLEIGEANWYGDMDPREILNGLNPAEHPYVSAVVNEPENLFEIAKAAYTALWAPNILEAVDMNGTERAFRQDLNGPLTLPRLYDTIINHGTAEHIFNVGMPFKSMHDWCKVGGYMIHESPHQGWPDHGFYNFQPGLFYDLSLANKYELVSLSIAHIESRQIIRIECREHFHAIAESLPKNPMLFVVLKKTTDQPFRVPMQSIYSGNLSETAKESWKSLR